MNDNYFWNQKMRLYRPTPHPISTIKVVRFGGSKKSGFFRNKKIEKINIFVIKTFYMEKFCAENFYFL